MSHENLFKAYKWEGIVYKRLKRILAAGSPEPPPPNEVLREGIARLQGQQVDPRPDYLDFLVYENYKLRVKPEQSLFKVAFHPPSCHAYEHPN